MIIPSAEEIIRSLDMVRHPEGGWFKETYRAAEIIPAVALPDRFSGDRSFCTAIYFLLEKGAVSAFHRIKSDELWFFHAGASLAIHAFRQDGEYQTLQLGADLTDGSAFQRLVPAGSWFGAEVSGRGDFSLVGCTVAPGFDFADFEMADREALMLQFPSHGELIRRLTHEKS